MPEPRRPFEEHLPVMWFLYALWGSAFAVVALNWFCVGDHHLSIGLLLLLWMFCSIVSGLVCLILLFRRTGQ